MGHYRLLYPSEFLNAPDLGDKEVSVTIEKIVVEEVKGGDGKKQMKPVLYMKGAKKRFPLPKTCAKVIAGKFGNDTAGWIGKKVTLYPTTCDAFGIHDVECIRVKVED
jgi:hypothetical protein